MRDLLGGWARLDREQWFDTLKGSLEEDPETWLREAVNPGRLSTNEAWTLLAWVELAASRLVACRDEGLLATSAFGVGLVSHCNLDRRDISVVAALLRRGAALIDVDFVASVEDGTARAGAAGSLGFKILVGASDTTPATHLEIGRGASFQFTRVDTPLDLAQLQPWLDGNAE